MNDGWQSGETKINLVYPKYIGFLGGVNEALIFNYLRQYALDTLSEFLKLRAWKLFSFYSESILFLLSTFFFEEAVFLKFQNFAKDETVFRFCFLCY